MPSGGFRSGAPALGKHRRIIALLGKQDAPTDALRDHCAQLASSLAPCGFRFEIEKLRWDTLGWKKALEQLAARRREWSGAWVHLHYTALAWSRRGFPFHLPDVIRSLHREDIRCAVVFHESRAAAGRRLRDRIRARSQHRLMRKMHALADRSIFTVPLDEVHWLPRPSKKALFIPIGSQVPECAEPLGFREKSGQDMRTVAVFCVSGGRQTSQEVQDIAFAVRAAKQHVANLRLVVMGRGVPEAEPALQAAMAGSGVAMDVRGVAPLEEISREFCAADVLLFVRGPVSPQRSSALAGIACGLPIVGYRSEATCFPVTEAGLELAPYPHREGLAEALVRVLADANLRAGLASRSRAAQREYFSWKKIAERYAEAFQDE